jgi:hypothetical protein
MRHQKLIGGGGSACRGGFLNLGLRFEIDRHQGLILGRMAFAAEAELQVRPREFFGIFQVLGELAMTSCTGEGSMFAPHLERFDHFMTFVACRLFLRNNFLCGRSIGETKNQRKKTNE